MTPLAAGAAEELSTVASLAFRQTYVGMGYYTDALVDDYVARVFAPEVLRGELAQGSAAFFGVYDQRPGQDVQDVQDVQRGRALVAYAKLTTREPPACVPAPARAAALAVERLYVLKTHQGAGLGRMLLTAMLGEAGRRGYTHVWLSTWELNTAAVRFYERLGLTVVGDAAWPFESGGRVYVDRDLVLVGPTAGPAGT